MFPTPILTTQIDFECFIFLKCTHSFETIDAHSIIALTTSFYFHISTLPSHMNIQST
jgi:hypothetical protein